MSATQLFGLWPSRIQRNVTRWWLQRMESHYRICAAVERDKSREHNINAAYYEKKAAMTKSDWLAL